MRMHDEFVKQKETEEEGFSPGIYKYLHFIADKRNKMKEMEDKKLDTKTKETSDKNTANTAIETAKAKENK